MRGKGYTLTRAAESYQKEHLSKFTRGDEQWRILEHEILPEISHVLLADLRPSQVMPAVVPMRKRAPRVAAQKAFSVALFASRQAGIYNVYAYADEMRKWLDRWAEHVAAIAAPRAKPARARPRERE